MSGSTLVSTGTLNRNLAAWRVFDCRHDLARPELGLEQYRAAHIPGAVFAHLDRDLSAPKTGANGRHPLPHPDSFTAWLGEQGVKPADQVICYDGGNGSMAARLWWLLRWVGHEAVAVLDGGLAKWTKEGRPVTGEVRQFTSTDYPLRLRREAAISLGVVQKNLKDLFLLDARAPERFRGEKEPIDPVAGHIPGAKNRFNGDNVLADGTFKDKDSLRKELSGILAGRDPSEIIHYCGSGVSACHNLLAMEHAGLPGGKLYAGSWSEWIVDPARPREKG